MRAPALLLLAAIALASCSSWDTGTDDGAGPENACLATVAAYARAAQRCGQDYAASYDALLRADANGDCKNVRSIRDEQALRGTCFSYVMTASCNDLAAGKSDPSCAEQLQRPE